MANGWNTGCIVVDVGIRLRVIAIRDKAATITIVVFVIFTISLTVFFSNTSFKEQLKSVTDIEE